MTGTHISILITAVLLFLSSSTISHAGPVTNQCADNSECHSSLTCILGTCSDPCSQLSQGDRGTCSVKNHVIQWTCNPGFEHPRGGNLSFCLPVEWACYVADKDINHFVKCNKANWTCIRSSREMICGFIRKNDESEDDSEDEPDDESDYESDIESE